MKSVHATPKPVKLDRFKYHIGGGLPSGGHVKIAPDGDLIRLADVHGLMGAALQIDLYGASVSSLERLGRELRRIGLLTR